MITSNYGSPQKILPLISQAQQAVVGPLSNQKKVLSCSIQYVKFYTVGVSAKRVWLVIRLIAFHPCGLRGFSSFTLISEFLGQPGPAVNCKYQIAVQISSDFPLISAGKRRYDVPASRMSGLKSQPAGRAHCDYTVISGLDRSRAVLPEEADNLARTPYAVIQVCSPAHSLSYGFQSCCSNRTVSCLLSMQGAAKEPEFCPVSSVEPKFHLSTLKTLKVSDISIPDRHDARSPLAAECLCLLCLPQLAMVFRLIFSWKHKTSRLEHTALQDFLQLSDLLLYSNSSCTSVICIRGSGFG